MRPSPSRFRRAALAAFTAALVGGATVSAEPLRVFFIGNSVTDSLRYKAFAALAAKGGTEITWGRHMIPGSPLFLLWKENSGFTERFGPSRKALTEHAWDVVSVQPFDRKLTSKSGEGDLEVIQQMIDAQVAQNPAVRFYVFSRWPRMASVDGKPIKFDKYDYDPSKPGDRPDLARIKPWSELWERPFRADAWDNSNETRDYFEQVVTRLREANPKLKEPVRMIPVGDVFAELDRRMRAGQVPGFDNIWLLYKDGIHVNDHGSYVTALTFYATLLRKSPVGLPVGEYGAVSPDALRVFQETVWDVVSKHPLAGVAN